MATQLLGEATVVVVEPAASAGEAEVPTTAPRPISGTMRVDTGASRLSRSAGTSTGMPAASSSTPTST